MIFSGLSIISSSYFRTWLNTLKISFLIFSGIEDTATIEPNVKKITPCGEFSINSKISYIPNYINRKTLYIESRNKLTSINLCLFNTKFPNHHVMPQKCYSGVVCIYLIAIGKWSKYGNIMTVIRQRSENCAQKIPMTLAGNIFYSENLQCVDRCKCNQNSWLRCILPIGIKFGGKGLDCSNRDSLKLPSPHLLNFLNFLIDRRIQEIQEPEHRHLQPHTSRIFLPNTCDTTAGFGKCPKTECSTYDIRGGGVTYINGKSNLADKYETHSDAINSMKMTSKLDLESRLKVYFWLLKTNPMTTPYLHRPNLPCFLVGHRTKGILELGLQRPQLLDD
ncbi:hypothetical protein AGLY_002448 [Aphis glycines]|uniref:Uncharacterized protein n=1 Tax=Aphis glycines TaxID=307491 RepID=A0A6G0U0P0_APHGL|nr:hypothetical protein AGLY_002448 [Aphis glycines]